MSKLNIANALKQRFNFTGVAARQIVDSMIDDMVATLVAKGRLGIPGFGTFLVRPTPARRAINPRTGEKVSVAAGYTVRFRPSPLLREKVSKQSRKRKSDGKAKPRQTGRKSAKAASRV